MSNPSLNDVVGNESVPTLLAVAVGNTRTRVGFFRGGELKRSASASSGDPDAVALAVQDLFKVESDPGTYIAAVASVHEAAAEPIRKRLVSLDPAPALVCPVGGLNPDAVPIELTHSVDDGAAVGVDRLLDAIGGYRLAQQACVVIDAGTAVTVDFVDGEGVFHGGAIAPGAAMAMRALAREAEALPEAEFKAPSASDEPYGRNTVDAMQRGVAAQIRGMVRHLTEEYAVSFGAYPRVIATGGDAAALFEDDELVEHVVPDLQLQGIWEVFRRAAGLEDEAQPKADASGA